jgi:membrane fusion protein, multidrug efflux system
MKGWQEELDRMRKVFMVERAAPYPLLLRLLLCFICLSVLVGCQKKESKPPERIFNVQVSSAERQQLRPFMEATGTLYPYEEVTVSAEIEGLVKTVKAEEGMVIAKGVLLATIDDTEFSHEAIRAQAAVKQAEATLANTQLEFQRKEALYKEELVTRQQFDDVSTRLVLSEADVERAKAALSIARQKLSKTRVHAPLSAAVKEKKVSVGDFVKNGTPLFVLIQPNPIKLKFSVPERETGRLAIGQDVLFHVEAFPGQEFKGKISVIYPSIEEKTRTLMVEALVPNPGTSLKPGLFAKLTLYTGQARDTIVVPITSLLYEGDKVRIFVADGDRASERSVKLGNKYGEVMEIVEGLKEGEKVVVAGQQSLSDGAKVSQQSGSGSRPAPSSGK